MQNSFNAAIETFCKRVQEKSHKVNLPLSSLTFYVSKNVVEKQLSMFKVFHFLDLS